MKTDDLITMLAREAGPAPRAPAAARLAPALGLGLAGGLLGALWAKDAVPMALLAEPGMWIKFGYAALLALAAAWWVARLARPVARLRPPAGAVAGVGVAMALLGLAAVLGAPAEARLDTVMGSSWRSCPTSVALLALPALAGTLWALRGLAPTRPRLAGFAAGLMSGAVGAFAYAVTCDELSPAFVAVWYSLGIAASAALGALLGPRLLRW
jgi:hypothetical protein